jgi:hypothetical protein
MACPLAPQSKRPGAALKAERASVVAKGKAASEAAPIQYLAAVFGGAHPDTAIRWLILMMVLCCDPLAIALTAAATARQATKDKTTFDPQFLWQLTRRCVPGPTATVGLAYSQRGARPGTDIASDHKMMFQPPNHRDKPNNSIVATGSADYARAAVVLFVVRRSG